MSHLTITLDKQHPNGFCNGMKTYSTGRPRKKTQSVREKKKRRTLNKIFQTNTNFIPDKQKMTSMGGFSRTPVGFFF